MEVNFILKSFLRKKQFLILFFVIIKEEVKLLTKIVKTRLKEILDERGLSIRGFAFGNDLSFETVRRLYNNTAKQYQRETLGNICEALDIKIEDLLYITEDDSNDS